MSTWPFNAPSKNLFYASVHKATIQFKNEDKVGVAFLQIWN